MIDQATIQKIFDAADIYEVVSDFVSLKKEESTTSAAVLFIMKRQAPSPYRLPKAYTNASVAAKGEMS